MKVWKFLFWLSVALVGYAGVDLTFDKDADLFDYLSYFMVCFGLIIFYGFAYQKNVAPRGIAIAVFLGNFTLSVGIVGYSIYSFYSVIDAFILAILVCTSLICVMLLIPQYKYAYQSSHLWQSNA